MNLSKTLPSKPILFIDRDGVILQEPATDFQVDNIDKTRFVAGAITALSAIAKTLNFYLVMVTNQDGLGSDSFPTDKFQPSQQLMLDTLAGEGIIFDEIHIDSSFEKDNRPTRKPNIGMVQHFLDNPAFDLTQSFVIGDRWTDIQLAKNLGIKAIYLRSSLHSLSPTQAENLRSTIALETHNWQAIYSFLKLGSRTVLHQRKTNETDITINLNIDGNGISNIHTGLGFFDHMLDQLARHGGLDLSIDTKGDLHIDEHHTIEDTAIALGAAFHKALHNKLGMERYGFALPMDDAAAQVLIDFGGRSWLVWNADFKREKIGDMPTELFYHFFKSFSDAAQCNLNITATGENEHHKIEAIFKAFAKAVKMAIQRNPFSNFLPSTKGIL